MIRSLKYLLTGVPFFLLLVVVSPALALPEFSVFSKSTIKDDDQKLFQYDSAVREGAFSSSDVQFAVIGDYGVAGQPQADVATLVKSWNPGFIITLGDNNYPLGEAATIDANIGQYYHDYIYPYTGSYGAGASVNRFYPILGNHDWYTSNAQPYLDYFDLPGNERYYDFVKGPVHFFVLDSDVSEPDGNAANSVQAAWLQNALALSSSAWNIVLLHHTPYSSSVHGSNVVMQWPYKAWGVDAVLAGHDHTYERIHVDGLPYFVNGLGGNSYYGFVTPVAGSQVRYTGDYGAMLVNATDLYISFQFITRGGVLIDSYGLGDISTSLVNSTLPTSRTVLSGTNATIFTTVLNAGSAMAQGVALSMSPQPVGTFTYYQTDCTSNAIISAQNPVLDVPAGGRLCYLLLFTPGAPFTATSVHVKAQAENALPTNLLTGINTWLLRSMDVDGPDVIALTTTTDLHQTACSGTNAFAVALSNVGEAASGDITAFANTGSISLPLSILINETNQGTGAIIGDNILQNVSADDIRTVAVFLSFSGCIPFDPALNRIFIEFRDASNNVVGSTSTAVSTNR